MVLKDLGERLLITSAGREFQMGIISTKRRVSMEIGLGIWSKEIITPPAALNMGLSETPFETTTFCF